MKQEIINCLIWYANRVSETISYYNKCNSNVCIDEFRIINELFTSEVSKYINFYKLTREEALELGFRRFNTESNIYLIPIYLIPIIPIGTELKSIDGDTIIYVGTIMDRIRNDILFDTLAYGIYIPEEDNKWLNLKTPK